MLGDFFYGAGPRRIQSRRGPALSAGPPAGPGISDPVDKHGNDCVRDVQGAFVGTVAVAKFPRDLSVIGYQDPAAFGEFRADDHDFDGHLEPLVIIVDGHRHLQAMRLQCLPHGAFSAGARLAGGGQSVT